MVTTFCFAERRLELWREACVRGWLQAVLDFPKLKSREDAIAFAQHTPDELRSQVCCVTSEFSYRHLVVYGWEAAYRSVKDLSEREIAFQKAILAPRPRDEALVIVQEGCSTDGAKAVLDAAYAQYVTLAAAHP